MPASCDQHPRSNPRRDNPDSPAPHLHFRLPSFPAYRRMSEMVGIRHYHRLAANPALVPPSKYTEGVQTLFPLSLSRTPSVRGNVSRNDAINPTFYNLGRDFSFGISLHPILYTNRKRRFISCDFTPFCSFSAELLITQA